MSAQSSEACFGLWGHCELLATQMQQQYLGPHLHLYEVPRQRIDMALLQDAR